MKIQNFTPHAIHFHADDKIVTLPSVGLARVSQQSTVDQIYHINGIKIPVTNVSYTGITGLPDKQPDTLLIVSALVKDAGKKQGRDDLVSPDDFIRDDQGRITGCKAFAL